MKYTPSHLAAAIGQSTWTVRAYLREQNPDHSGWWTLNEHEFRAALAELRTKGPRRRGGLRKRKLR